MIGAQKKVIEPTQVEVHVHNPFLALLCDDVKEPSFEEAGSSGENDGIQATKVAEDATGGIHQTKSNEAESS